MHLNADCPERISLESLRQHVTVYLNTEVLLHFTDHGIGHSDRMTGIIVDLVKPMHDRGKGLSSQELTILYAACYLHDLGMHVETLSGLNCVPADWHDLSNEARFDIIRDRHHLISAELIQKATQHLGPCATLSVQDIHPDEVACLCEAHNLWLEKTDEAKRYADLTKEIRGIRMDLLSALLRLADILDEAQLRSCIEKSKILDLDITAQKHWWRHYYTEYISFSQQDRTITLEFKFPKDHEQEYSGIVPELQYPRIACEIDRHEQVLAKNDCSWHLTKVVEPLPYSSKEILPVDVELSMLEELQARRDEAEEKQRIAALTDLREARPLVQRQMEELNKQKNVLAPKEFVSQALALYRRLWLAGGKRSAWMAFEQAYKDRKVALPDEVQVECECQLAEWRRKCGFTFGSEGELQALQLKLDKMKSDRALCFRLNRELFLSLYDLGIYYRDAMEVALKAMECAPTNADKLLLLSDMAEMSLLCGEPTGAVKALKDNESLFQGILTAESVRCRLLNWRLQAMVGNLDSVITDIDAQMGLLNAKESEVVRVRCLLLKAELFRVAGNLPAATSVFRDELWEKASKLPAAQSLTIASCYQDVAINNREERPLVGFYELVDERTVASVEFEDERHALSGMDTAAANKHYDAMASFVKAARNMYRQDNWPGMSNAFRRLARESVTIKSLHDAVFYAVMARDQELIKNVAVELRNNADQVMIERAISFALQFACLPLHARTTCILLGEISDEIPESRVGDVVSYLLKCTEIRTTGGFSPQFEVSEAAWTALKLIAKRLPDAVAQNVAVKILAEDLPGQNVLTRRVLTPLLEQLVPKLTSTQIETLSRATVSLVTEKKHDIDFHEAIELLATTARHASAEIKSRIADKVYPEGKCKGNGLLLQLASSFNVKLKAEEIDDLARWLLQRLNNQILNLDITADVPKSDSNSFARIVDGRRIVTHDMPVALVWGLVRHIELASTENRTAILGVLLNNLQNKEDSVENKCSTLGLLPAFLVACGEEEQKRTIQIVATMASSPQIAPSGAQSREEANHPLQRFRVHAGTPEQVRGTAIRCLVALTRQYPEQSQHIDVQNILEVGFSSDSDDVRRYSFLAAQEDVALSSPTVMRILIGTRDQSAVTAASAFYVFGNNKTIQLKDLAPVLCYSLWYGVRNPDKRLREACAKVILRLKKAELDPSALEEVNRLAETLGKDRSWKIRQTVAGGTKDATADVSKDAEMSERR
jgi:hypothetical protein